MAEAAKHIDPTQKALMQAQKSVHEEKLKYAKDVAVHMKKESYEIDIRNAKYQLESISSFISNDDQLDLTIDEVNQYKVKRKEFMNFLALSDFQA